MRFVIISIICLTIIILSWGLFYFLSIEKTVLYYWDELEELSQIVGNENWLEANRRVEIYTEKWMKTRELWIFFLNQHVIDDIDISIYRLKKNIENNNVLFSQGEIEELRVKFNIVKENECLTWENIF